MAQVVFEKVHKIYEGRVEAVKNLNLVIPDGSFVVFVGPSGCGKSTVLRMIAGLETVTDGKLYIDEKLMNNVHPRERDIAMVFQNYALYPHMNAYDNMAFGLKLRYMPAMQIEERVLDAAQKLGLSDLLDRMPKTLSGGQRQRVALGRAMVRMPKVFLLDEPLSNLDAKFRAQMRSEIVTLHRKLKTTFVYVTHDQLEAMTMATQIVIMKDGIVHQADTPQNVYDYPSDVFTAGFIGLPQMNFMDAELTSKKDEIHIQICGGEYPLPDSVKKRIEKKYTGIRKLYAGIRSEDMDLVHGQAAGEGIRVSGKIDLIENLGNEKLVYVSAEEKAGSLIYRAPQRKEVSCGENIQLFLNAERLHLFDKDTEKSILKRRNPYEL